MRPSHALTAALLLAAPAAALADNLTYPPWIRGLPGTTFQEFDFDPSRPYGWNPNGFHNPYGGPQVTVSEGASYLPGTFPGQTPDISTATGWWCLPPGDFIQFFIPNHYELPPHEKLVFIQASFVGALSVSVTFPDGSPFSQTTTTSPDPHGATGGESYQTFTFSYPGCESYEFVRITNPSLIDNLYISQVVIDTLCHEVPTPGGAGLLGIGLLAAARRRR